MLLEPTSNITGSPDPEGRLLWNSSASQVIIREDGEELKSFLVKK